MWKIRQVVVKYKDSEVTFDEGWEPFEVTEGQGYWIVWIRQRIK